MTHSQAYNYQTLNDVVRGLSDIMLSSIAEYNIMNLIISQNISGRKSIHLILDNNPDLSLSRSVQRKITSSIIPQKTRRQN